MLPSAGEDYGALGLSGRIWVALLGPPACQCTLAQPPGVGHRLCFPGAFSDLAIALSVTAAAWRYQRINPLPPGVILTKNCVEWVVYKCPALVLNVSSIPFPETFSRLEPGCLQCGASFIVHFFFDSLLFIDYHNFSILLPHFLPRFFGGHLQNKPLVLKFSFQGINLGKLSKKCSLKKKETWVITLNFQGVLRKSTLLRISCCSDTVY